MKEREDDVWSRQLVPLGLSFKKSTYASAAGRKGRGLFLALDGSSSLSSPPPPSRRRPGPLSEPADPWVVLSSAPFAFVLSAEFWGAHCNRCLSRACPLLRCSGCKVLHYCSRACQKRDWQEHHRYECKSLPRALLLVTKEEAGGRQRKKRDQDVLSDLILLYRTYRRLMQEPKEEDEQQGSSTTEREGVGGPLRPSARQLLDLDGGPLLSSSPWGGAVEQVLREKAKELLPPLTLMLGAYCKDKVEQPPSYLEVLTMLRRFQSNNFGIVDGLWRPLGAGVYPFGALLQHSCRPNCLLSYRFDPSTLSFVQEVRFLLLGQQQPAALTPTDPDHDDDRRSSSSDRGVSAVVELCHSYTDVILPRPARRQLLQRDYAFLCTCPACCHRQQQGGGGSHGADDDDDSNNEDDDDGKEEEEEVVVARAVELMERAACLEQGKEEEEATLLNKALHQLLQLQQQRQPAAAQEGTQQQEAVAVGNDSGRGSRRGVGSSSSSRRVALEVYRARGKLMGLAVEQGRDDVALGHARAMLPYMRAVYSHAPHPLVGLHLYTMGDLLLQLQEQQPHEAAASSSASKSGGTTGNSSSKNNNYYYYNKEEEACGGGGASSYHREALAILRVTHGPFHELVKGLETQLAASTAGH